MASTNMDTIYADALRNTRALEKQGLEQMERHPRRTKRRLGWAGSAVRLERRL